MVLGSGIVIDLLLLTMVFFVFCGTDYPHETEEKEE